MILVSGATATVARYANSGRLGRLLRPGNGNRPDALPWAADHGAFAGFDAAAFAAFLGRISGAPGCLWVAAPDVVADHAATVARFAEWEPRIHAAGLPVAFVLQDGCSVDGVPWGSCEAIFIGGSTAFKLSELARDLVHGARRRGKRSHMGRVNTARRLRAAHEFGVDTVDGTTFSRFPDIKIPWAIAALDTIERHGHLFAQRETLAGPDGTTTHTAGPYGPITDRSESQ